MSRFLHHHHHHQPCLPPESSNTPASPTLSSLSDWSEDCGHDVSAFSAIRRFESLMEIGGLTLCGAVFRERLASAFEAVVDRTQDFTDSAYTRHENREKILLICDHLKQELNQLLRIGVCLEDAESPSPSEDLEIAIQQTLRASKELKYQLNLTALNQADELFKLTDEVEIVNKLRSIFLSGDTTKFNEGTDILNEHAEQLQEVCKLLFHVSPSENLQTIAKSCESRTCLYWPQLSTAFQSLCFHPVSASKKTTETFDTLVDLWLSLCCEVHRLSLDTRDLLKIPFSSLRRFPHMSSPAHTMPYHPKRVTIQERAANDPSGVTSSIPLHAPAASFSDQCSYYDPPLEPQQQMHEPSLPLMPQPPPAGGAVGGEVPADGWPESKDNDIVKRARAMMIMAQSMHQFTRGAGELKTTQDLFTQAEFFAEEANKFYKVVRHFTYQVPSGPLKKELLENLDKVPTFVQQLQFAVKNSTVGKAATFTKVDNVIQESKNLMSYVTRTVDSCLTCSSAYKLDMVARVRSRTLSPSGRGYGDDEEGMGSRGGGGSSDDPSL